MTGDDPKYPDNADTRGLRSEGRDSLFLNADIRVAGGVGAEAIRVRNLSASGLMAESAVLYAVGTSVVIDLHSVGEVPGRVVWSMDGRMGIAFQQDINPANIRQAISSGLTAPASQMRAFPHRRPGLKLS